MNIGYLQETLSSITEVKPLGKTAEVNGVLCHIIGLVRYGDILRLAALQYDDEFAERAEAAEIAELNGLHEKPETNRERLRGDRSLDMTNIFHAVQTIRIGEKQFEINEMETSRCDWQNWQIPVLLTEFLKQGWNPAGLEYQSMENLFLTFMRLSGDYDCLPDVGENPAVQLTFRREHIPHPVEQPLTLSVGTDYPDKLYFQDKNTGEKHWVQINRVYLADMWAEMRQTFNDPRLTEQFSAAELAEHQGEFERRFVTICPQGMCFPVIEYECEEDLYLQFYSQEWLDNLPQSNSSCIGFIMKPDKKAGISGLPLKAAVIEEPMPADRRIIDTELFSCSLPRQYDDVIL
ncbi:hypothetical protein Dhaf_0589 [Desulfitobacterium hafniense DCB-2]|uniref:Uncharacterized protein n=1 Tax=Desulfitobacterium hafniense (strain DSM 10664 / DCB-2) TaxID=272564 RepID=B8FV09_DESHD|nr:hypothetical protein [Desulfitobacterium hafniense]ACL18655.1 hypothetical protein Dhaf_0589 [Desulfitobacterium hafniense DCB-2]